MHEAILAVGIQYEALEAVGFSIACLQFCGEDLTDISLQKNFGTDHGYRSWNLFWLVELCGRVVLDYTLLSKSFSTWIACACRRGDTWTPLSETTCSKILLKSLLMIPHVKGRCLYSGLVG